MNAMLSCRGLTFFSGTVPSKLQKAGSLVHQNSSWPTRQSRSQRGLREVSTCARDIQAVKSRPLEYKKKWEHGYFAAAWIHPSPNREWFGEERQAVPHLTEKDLTDVLARVFQVGENPHAKLPFMKVRAKSPEKCG